MRDFPEAGSTGVRKPFRGVSQGTLETDAAAHWSSAVVLRVDPDRVASEVTTAFAVTHFTTFHS